MPRTLPIVLLLAGIAACTPTPPDPPGPRAALPEEASLLRRLAEAVDGYRDGRPRFVVARRQFPHAVDRVFEDSSLAAARAGALGGEAAGFGVFGPFRAQEAPPEIVEVADIVDSVVVYTRGNPPKSFSADTVDAMFWGLSAFDKFIAPYLTSVYGPRYAAQHREWYRTKSDSSLAHSSLITHYRRSF